MTSLRSCLLLAAASCSLCACLSTPDSAPSIDATGADAGDVVPDAEPIDEPDPVTGCAAGDCEQFLAIGLWRHDPDTSASVVISHRASPTASWTAIPTTWTPDYNIFQMVWADIGGPAGDLDGLPDLVALAWNAVHVIQLRDDEGVLSSTPTLEVTGSAIPTGGGLHVADLGGDGAPEIVTGMPNLRYHRNTTPGWDSPVPIDDVAAVTMSPGNWDDDPALELLVSDNRVMGPPPDGDNGRGIGVFEDGPGGWGTFVPLVATNVKNVLWCDVLGDARSDVVIADYWGLEVYVNSGVAVDGNWLDMQFPRPYGTPGQQNVSLACGDIDGDGRDDLLFTSASGIRAILHGSISHTLVWDPASVGTAATQVSDLELADLDHDGYPDLLVTLRDDLVLEDTAEPVAYLIPNRSGIEGELAVGTPELLLTSRHDALSISWTELDRSAR